MGDIGNLFLVKNAHNVGFIVFFQKFTPVRKWKLESRRIRAYNRCDKRPFIVVGPSGQTLYLSGLVSEDLETGELLSATNENQAYRICKELDFDILLTGHQHQPKAGLQLFGTHACQSPDRGKQYVRVDAAVSEAGAVTVRSRLEMPGDPQEELADFLAPLDVQNAVFLDQPLGHLDIPLAPGDHMDMAVNGSVIANFFNQVQLEASGADISVSSLANVVKGFNQQVTIRDVVATYVFPNTLKTLRVNRSILKAALERCAEYFDLDEAGQLQVGQSFLKPIIQHYNYDYLSGMEVTMDVRRPVGDRVISMRYQGKELPINRPKDAIDNGIAMLTEDRRATGIMGVLSIADNISVASLKKYLDFGFCLNNKKVEDLVQGHYEEDLATDCGDFVVRRADGVYVYQLAVTVDDGEAGVTEVVRGMDLLSSAPRQMYLQELFGFPHPQYGHVPMLLAPDGRRLSKRDKDLDLGELRKRLTPEQLIGNLAFASGLIDTLTPISARELAKEFSWNKLRKDNIYLDIEALG